MESVPTQETEPQNPDEALNELHDALKKDEEIKIEVPKYGLDEKSKEEKFSEFLTKSKPEDIYKSFQEGKYSYEDIMGGKVKADPNVLKYFSKEDWMKVHGVEDKEEKEKSEEDLKEKIDEALEKSREFYNREKPKEKTEEKKEEPVIDFGYYEGKKEGVLIAPDTEEMTLEDVVKIAESFDKNNKENLPDQKEVENELDKLPEETKKKIGIGLDTIGFLIEEKKNNFFAKTFDFVSKGFDKKGTMGRFFSALNNNFTEYAENSRKKLEDMRSGTIKKGISSAYLAGNILKYGRTVADIVGYSVASPLRYVMAGSMAVSEGSKAAKDARLANEEVIEKTRVKDIDEAADEAWKIYEEVQKKVGDKEVNKKELQKAYQENIPKNLLERLKKDPEPGVASNILQKIMRKDVEWSAGRIDKKLKEIDSGKNISDEEKEVRKEKIISKYSKHLNDLDRMVSNYGAVDTLAMAAKYTEKGSKALVYGMMVQTLTNLIDKVFIHGAPEVLVSTMDVTQSNVGEESVINTAEKMVGEYDSAIIEVKSGDNVWKLVENQLEGRNYFGNLTGSAQEVADQKNYIIDAIKDKIVENPKAFGIISGNADLIKVGEKIDLSSIFEKNASNIGLGSIIEKAQGINEEDVANILSHKEAPEISHHEIIEPEFSPEVEALRAQIDSWDKSIFSSETGGEISHLSPEESQIPQEPNIPEESKMPETPNIPEEPKPEIQDVPAKSTPADWSKGKFVYEDSIANPENNPIYSDHNIIEGDGYINRGATTKSMKEIFDKRMIPGRWLELKNDNGKIINFEDSEEARKSLKYAFEKIKYLESIKNKK